MAIHLQQPTPPGASVVDLQATLTMAFNVKVHDMQRRRRANRLDTNLQKTRFKISASEALARRHAHDSECKNLTASLRDLKPSGSSTM